MGETIKECDKKYWANIIRSRINEVVAKLGIFPCMKFIRLMVKKSDLENHWIIDHKLQPIASFQPSNLETRYRFPEAEQYMDEQWREEAMKTNKRAFIKEWCMYYKDSSCRQEDLKN